jgi:dihydrodipicolinate synthase/N-acetylneuraminate lyase
VASSSPLSGVFPVLQTPFDKSGRIDDATLRREIDWVLECGADGLAVAMVSEILRLNDAERRELAVLVCSMAADRPTVVSVGGESTRVAAAFAEHAQSIGAAAVMATPPLSVAVSEDELERYYDAIAAATELPLIVQDASSYVGTPMSLSVQVNLQARHGERLYFKPEAKPVGPRLSALLAATGGAARVYDGSGGIALIDTFRRGIVGTMPSADLCWAIVRMWQAMTAGDYDTAYRISMPLSALVAMQTSLDGFVAIEKYLLAQQKIFVNTVCRGPVDFELDETTKRQLDDLLGFLKSAYENVTPESRRFFGS